MKIYSIPKVTKTIIFDIDGTLYNSQEYVAEQVDVQVRHWAKINGMTEDEGRKKMNDFRKKWSLENGGKKISLGNAFTHFGIDIETSIQWRNTLLEPEKFLKKDPLVIETLEKLQKKFFLIAVTNNPVHAAYRTLAAVGLEKLISDIVGLDTCKLSKPAEPMLLKALEISGSKAENALAIGDRYDIDVALPLKMGMGGITVKDSTELYGLPKILGL